MTMTVTHHPSSEGLYDPRNEHDSCGIGFVVDIRNCKYPTPFCALSAPASASIYPNPATMRSA